MTTSNTTSTTREIDGENGKELEPIKEQEKPNQGMEKEVSATEEAVNNTTDNPKIDGILLFGVGGNRNENQQKDRTNIITESSIELTEKEEHGRASLITKPVMNIVDDDKSSDNNDNDNEDNDDNVDDDGVDQSDMPGLQENYEPIIVKDTYEYNFLFSDTKLGLELRTGGRRKGVWVSKVKNCRIQAQYSY